GNPTGGNATGGSTQSNGGTSSAGTGGSSAGSSGAGTGSSPGTIMATPDDAATAYAAFKSYFETCGDGSIRVKTNGDETVSEGIAYGMLAAVGNDDQASFAGLWSYYQNHQNQNGLMDWKINACSGEVWEAGAASDADLDAAMALVQADCKWGGYLGAATTLMASIRNHEVATSGAELVLKPGDAWGGENCTNPSYFAPGYYRVFAQKHGAEAATWNKLADDSYVLLERTAHDSTGLVPDWSDAWGNPGGGGGCRNDKVNYTYDAARTPWRFATDYVWFQNQSAASWLNKVTAWVPDIYNLGDGFSLSGSELSSNHNSVFVGGFALGAMASSEEKKSLFMGAFLSVNPSADNAYFQVALRSVYLLLAAGLFPAGC
ncbi:MAG TPA: glycosyl hydrolase family 8, partial [Polyangiaceae bacterium]|nr:glycosyl hydrolase family 8 [Polyangiaceae bacterium]